MINLRNILSKIYANRTAEELYSWLDNQGLQVTFKRVVSQLNSLLKDEELLIKNCKSLPIGHIATNLLCAVNKQIASEGNPERAKEMENILGDICLQVLLTFLESLKTDKVAAWIQINYALKDTCEFHNYDYIQLIQFLKIDAGVSYIQSQRSADYIVTLAATPSLCWKGNPVHQSDFLDIFTNQNLIKSKRGLAKLFDSPTLPLQLQFNTAMADLTLQFFYTVKKTKLVTHTGCKGLYQALEFHIVDFRKYFLKNHEAGRRINALRQTLSKWNDNQRRIDSWLSGFQVNKTGLLTVSQT